MILDIGCGNNPRGDINVDIKQTLYTDCICHAEQLPFKDNSFEMVKAHYVIEHCLNPIQMVLEAIRVAKKKIKIVTDDIHFPGWLLYYVIRKGFLINESEHLYGWTRYYMKNFLQVADIPYQYKITGIVDCNWGKDFKQFQRRLFYWIIIKPLSIFWKPAIKIEIYKE